MNWEKHCRVPVALQHSRMVNLPKKSNAGIVDIENIRPITILSCFWRVWAGAYVKSPFVQKWLASLPEEIVAGKGADAQLAASELSGEMRNYKFGASMDYAKAYDCMSAPATCALLEKGSWCPNFCKVILGVWGAQRRWVSWAGHTGGLLCSRTVVSLKVALWGLSPCVLGCVAVSTGSVLKLPLVLRASLWTTVLFCLNRATGFCVRLRAGKTSRLPRLMVARLCLLSSSGRNGSARNLPFSVCLRLGVAGR